MEVIASFQQLIADHRVQSPLAGGALRPPATIAALDRLASRVPLPEDLRALLELHDGEEESDRDSPSSLPSYERLISAAEIEALVPERTGWTGADEASDYYSFCRGFEQYRPLVRPKRAWRAGWVPFAVFDGSISVWLIDLDPGPSGVRGQVVHCEPGVDPPLGVVAASLADLFDRLRVELAAGRSVPDGTRGGRVVWLGCLETVG